MSATAAVLIIGVLLAAGLTAACFRLRTAGRQARRIIRESLAPADPDAGYDHRTEDTP